MRLIRGMCVSWMGFLGLGGEGRGLGQALVGRLGEGEGERSGT